MVRILSFLLFIFIYGNTISCSHYKTYNIQKFCSSGDRPKTIELDKDEDDSAVIVKVISYKNYMDCNVFVEAEKGYGIVVNVKRVNLRNIVDKLKLDINRSLDPQWTGNKINDNKEKVTYVSDRKVKIEFLTGYSSESTKNKGFELILTSYRISNKCDKKEINCGNSRCISNFYQCDGNNNCGNNLDENGCLLNKQTNNFAIVGGLIGGLVGILLLCCCFRCCCGKSRKSKKGYVQFSGDATDSTKPVSQVTTVEPSAPISPTTNPNYGSTSSYPVRYPVNPNYPYFIDGVNAPQPHTDIHRPQQVGPHDHYSHFPPPPPYSPRNENDTNENIDSNHNRDQTSKY